MAFITLSGTLLDPNGDLAVGDQIRFTHKSTTGETVQSAVSIITVNPAGTYSLPLQYGLVLVEYKDIRTQQFKNLGVATVNQDNPATSIPELLNALVPVSSTELIEFQAILADCVAAQLAAENAATTAEAFAYQLTTTDLIASTATFAAETSIPTSGFTNSGDGGNGSWKQTGLTGQTPSKSPSQLGNGLLNDGNGNQWSLVIQGKSFSPKMIGAVGDFVADDYLPLVAFFNSVFSQLLAGIPVDIVGGNGVYGVSEGVKMTLTGNHVTPTNLDFSSLQIKALAGYSNTKPVFSIISKGTNRNLKFSGGLFDGSNIADDVFILDGGDKTSSEFLYNCVLDFVRTKNGINTCLEITGNVFESSMMNCHGQMQNTTGKVFNIVNRAPNALSSLEIFGGSTRGGLNGLYTDAGDIKITGGTYIESGEYAVDCRSGTGALLSGIHVENAWEDGSGSDNAGINLTGSGTIVHCLGTSVNGIMDTVVDVFSSNNIQVIGGSDLGGVSKVLRVKQNSASILTSGIKREKVSFATSSEESVTSFSDKGLVNRISSASGSITPDLNNFDTIDLTISANITLESPINGVTGDSLVIRMQQDGTGGHSISFGATFRLSTSPSIVASEQTMMEFYFTGGVWVEKSSTII
jgi:hypothetical protein